MIVKQGLLGGSFDPPHLGHYLAASDAFDVLCLDQLMFIPTGHQPLKVEGPAASPGQRLRMVELMVAGDDRFAVSRIEVARPGPSYTIDTLECLAAEMPAVERFLIVGADVLSTMAQWRQPDAIARLATIVVLNRGTPAKSHGGVPTTPISNRQVEISSTEIRQRVRSGKSIRGFVHPSVADYIATERLYQ